MNATVQKFVGRLIVLVMFVGAIGAGASCRAGGPGRARARRAADARGGEANLVVPDLSTVTFRGWNGRTLLMGGLGVCALGLLFGLMTFTELKNLPVHASMLEVSELIYETCKTYLVTQGRFILILWLFIAVIIAAYFGWLSPVPGKPIAVTLPIILIFSLIGIARQLRRGVVRHPREHVRQLARRVREPARQAVPDLRDSAAGGHEHRHAAHQRRAADDALHPAVHPGRLRGPVLHRLRHRRIARRGRAAHRRRHLHEDRRHRLGPDEDRLQHQGRRCEKSGRDCGLHRRQRGRLGGSERRRVRNLRRDRRRADLVHPPGRQQHDGAGPAAGLDLRDAHHDDRRERPLLLRQRGGRRRAVTATSTR